MQADRPALAVFIRKRRVIRKRHHQARDDEFHDAGVRYRHRIRPPLYMMRRDIGNSVSGVRRPARAAFNIFDVSKIRLRIYATWQTGHRGSARLPSGSYA